MTKELDGGFGRPGVQAQRKSQRVNIGAMVKLRRRGHHNFMVRVYDLSREGCRLEFMEPPQLDESVWIKFDGLEALEATVCWVKDKVTGVEFVRPIHAAVFDMLVGRLR
ncbi:MAG TPA: PilZ domain-containing protein [Sphingomicrobium sp.]|nr:PilZ domain-containing protein [Sphingomicrobium sp.]